MRYCTPRCTWVPASLLLLESHYFSPMDQMKTRQSRSIRIACVALAFAAGFCQQASADITYSKYKEFVEKATPSNPSVLRTLDMYISGLGEGIMWQDTQTKLLYGVTTICAPGQVGIGLDDYKAMIEVGAKHSSPRVVEETPIGLLISVGLMTTYPCKQK